MRVQREIDGAFSESQTLKESVMNDEGRIYDVENPDHRHQVRVVDKDGKEVQASRVHFLSPDTDTGLAHVTTAQHVTVLHGEDKLEQIPQ